MTYLAPLDAVGGVLHGDVADKSGAVGLAETTTDVAKELENLV